jgi:hypothetical protein
MLLVDFKLVLMPYMFYDCIIFWVKTLEVDGCLLLLLFVRAQGICPRCTTASRLIVLS